MKHKKLYTLKSSEPSEKLCENPPDEPSLKDLLLMEEGRVDDFEAPRISIPCRPIPIF